MNLEARYGDTVFDRYEHKFLDCGMVLIVSHLAARGAPVEWLFCDAYEDTDRIVDHCLQRNRRWWEYPGKLSRDSLPLIGAKLRAMKFDSFKQAKPAVLELLDAGKLVLFRVDTYYQPNRPNYMTEHRQGHTVALRAYAEEGGIVRFLVLDDLDMRALSKVFADEDVVEQMFDHSEFDDIYVLEEGHADGESVDLEHVMARYRFARTKPSASMRAVRTIRAYASGEDGAQLDAASRYQQISDAFKLLSGSRELYAAFMRKLGGRQPQLMSAAAPADAALLAAAEAAERLYLSFLRASLTGQQPRSMPGDIRHWFELEQAAAQAAASAHAMP